MTDVEVAHRPSPLTDEPSLRLCLACQTAWPCQARLDAIEPPAASLRRDLEAGEEALVAGVGLGWHVEGTEGMRYHHRTGGTVVHYSDDDEGDRYYRVLNWHRRHPIVVTLASADIEPAGVHEPNKRTLEGHATALAEYVGSGHGTREDRLVWLRMAAVCMELAV